MPSRFLSPKPPSGGRLIFIADEPFSQFYTSRYAIPEMKSRGTAFEIWSLGPSRRSKTDTSCDFFDVSNVEQLRKRIEHLTAHDIVILVDGFRHHERLTHRRLRKMLARSSAIKAVALFESSEIFYITWKSKVMLLSRRPDLWNLIRRNSALLIYRAMFKKLIPSCYKFFTLKLNEVYLESSGTYDLDTKLISNSTSVSHRSVLFQRVSTHHSRLKGRSRNQYPRNRLCLVIDPGFWLHSPDFIPPKGIRQTKPQDALQASRHLMLPTLHKLKGDLSEPWQILVSLHPNNHYHSRSNPYLPFQTTSDDTLSLIRQASLVVSFGSTLTEKALELRRNVLLVDTSNDLQTSLALELTAYGVSSCYIWRYKHLKNKSIAIKEIKPLADTSIPTGEEPTPTQGTSFRPQAVAQSD